MLINLVFSLKRGCGHIIDTDNISIPNTTIHNLNVVNCVSLIQAAGEFSSNTTNVVSSIYLYCGSLNLSDTSNLIENLPMCSLGIPIDYKSTSTGGVSPYINHHSKINQQPLTINGKYIKFSIFSNDFSDGSGSSGDIMGRATECHSLQGGNGTDIQGSLTNASRKYNENFYCNFYLFNQNNGSMTLPISVQTDDSVFMNVYYMPTDNSDVIKQTFSGLDGVIFSNADAFTGMTGGYVLKYDNGDLVLEYYNGINTTTLTYPMENIKGRLVSLGARFTSDGGKLYVDGIEVNSNSATLSNALASYTTLGAFYNGLAINNHLEGRYSLFSCFEGTNNDNLSDEMIGDIMTENKSVGGYRKVGTAHTPILPLFQYNFDDDEFDSTNTHTRVKFSDDDRIEASIQLL